MEKPVQRHADESRKRRVRRVLSLALGVCLAHPGPALSQEWGRAFNPYTGQWEDLNPPDRERSDSPAENAAVAAPQRPTDPVGESAAGPPPEPDYTSKEAALQILQHETAEAAKWVYEQPDCPRLHYHKPLAGKDVCSNPLGDDVEVSCPAGTSLITDYHPAGSDACRSRRAF